MGMLAKIRRMHLRDVLSIREISRSTGLSRNTVKRWLRQDGVTEPRYAPRAQRSVLDPWVEQLEAALRIDAYRPARDRRTAKALFEQIQALGYPGSYPRVVVWVRRWRERRAQGPRRAAFVPMSFELGDAFQFDWSCEYVFVGGLRRRLEVAHTKLASSRAFWLTAYPTQSHEMLFDAHARAFAAFGGVPRRGIYDNMKTAVDKVGIEPSVGSRGDSYDNALAETINGLYKTELIHRRAPWKSREAVELATLTWVSWFNHHRLMELLGYLPPAEYEANYYRQQTAQAVPQT